jgi:hypothetical protein
MTCENEDIKLVDRSDFNCIAQLATHCDNKKLCIAISEAQEFDLSGLLCDFWYDILEHIDNPEYKILLCGGTYEDCNRKAKRFPGLKRVLVYYSYSRYLLINEFNDTPSGNVSHTNDYSLAKSLKEISLFADKYRSMAYESWKKTELYLCSNKDKFPEFNSVNCPKCRCIEDNCNGSTQSQGYGIKTSIIKKKLPDYDLY